MRKNRLLVILLIPILFLLPFGNYGKAQIPSYVGVGEGEQYTWKAEVKFEGVDDFLDNIRDVLVDLKTNLPSLDLFGLESLTLADLYKQIAVVFFSNILPVGWEGLNISTLIKLTIEDYIVKFNSTILSGMIPSNWQALNFSDFYYLVFDGLNATLPSGWEDNPLPELYKMAINELNSTIFYGLIPAGWEDMTLGELLEALMMKYAPVMWESFVFQMMLETVMTLGIPPKFLDDTLSELIDQLVGLLPPEITSLNATALFDQMFFGLNQSMPGIESENMTTVIDFLAVMVNDSLPMGYGELSMTELLDLGIDELMVLMLPPELYGLTILEILDLGFTEAINFFDTQILPGWDETYLMLQAAGLLSYEVGLRVIINSIGTEIESYPGGPRGVPIDMNVSVSLDFENWMDLSMYGISSLNPLIIFSLLVYFGMPLTLPPLIVNPSTYSIVETALMDQFMLTSTLIVANNYDWTSIPTDLTIPTTGNPDSIEMSATWNNKGVLQKAEVKADGTVVASISLIGAAEEPIPGYEILIILGFTSIALIAIIFHLKRKNNIII